MVQLCNGTMLSEAKSRSRKFSGCGDRMVEEWTDGQVTIVSNFKFIKLL